MNYCSARHCPHGDEQQFASAPAGAAWPDDAGNADEAILPLPKAAADHVSMRTMIEMVPTFELALTDLR